MLTLFTVPKAFEGRMAVLQENAIRSWQQLSPAPEIILFGDDPGVAAAARRLGVRHIPDIRRNSFGTPLLGEVFRRADELATHDNLCFVNADIVFVTDFPRMLAHLPDSEFLVIGQRFDLKVEESIDYGAADWRERVYDKLLAAGSFLTMGMDYFLFRRHFFAGMPDFAIGRGFWDSWLVDNALGRAAVVIDATRSLVAVHQNHDYAHVRSVATRQYWKGPEAEENRRLSGFDHVRPPNFYDARLLLTPTGLKPARGLFHRGQRLYDFSTRHGALRPLYYLLKGLRRLGPLFHRFRRPRPVLRP